MPNYNLGSRITTEIQSAAAKCVDNYVKHQANGFPMDATAIETAIMKPSHLTTLRELENDGLDNIPHSNDIAVHLARDYMSELQRACIVTLSLPYPVFVPRASGCYGNANTISDDRLKTTLRLDAGVLTDERREALAVWANRAVRGRRARRMAVIAVQHALKACTSTGAIMATWPLIGQFGSTDKLWRDRFRNPPTRLASYVREMDPKLREAATQILLTAQMLPEWTHEPGTVLAEIKAWERLPNDPDFT